MDGTLECKLASIVVHAQELFGPGGHHFDKSALDALLADPDVRAWIADMQAQALAPIPRTQVAKRRTSVSARRRKQS